MRKYNVFLLTSLVFATLIYLSGCGDDSPPATNTAPEFEQETYSFTLAENAATGDEIGSLSATDADAGNTLTYSITTTQTDFAIDDGTGAVTVAEATLDFESTTSYTLAVQVSDGTDTDTADITVTITDVNESSPEFAFADNATSYRFSLVADAADGAEVGKIAATDADGTAMLSYTLSGEGAANFAITDGTNVDSGEEVTVAVATDADLSSLTSPVKLTVMVSDGDNTADAEVEIVITSVGTGTNVAPVFSNTPYTFNVASDAADGAVVGTVSATDLDEGDLLTYSLSGTDAGSFAISNTPVASGEEVSITVATNSDLPSLTSPVMLTIEVSDGTNQATANVEITISKGNVAPVFDQTAYTFTVDPEAASGTVVGTILATDSNTGDLLAYSLSGTDADHFAISNTPVASGTAVSVTVAANADLSSLTSPVTLIITVTDDETPALTATANVEITITAAGVNMAPVFASTDYTFNVASDAAEGTTVGTVSATDSNTGDLLAYSLSGTDADHFAIDNTAVASGTAVSVTVAANADLPSITSPVALTVTVSDGTLMATATVEITITAENVAPVFDQTAYTFTIASGSADGAIVGPVSATDSNTGAMLTYSISGTDAESFAIDNTAVASSTAVSVTVAANADLPSITSPVTLTVTVSDGTLMATATVKIIITAENVPLVFADAPYHFTITSNAAKGAIVGTVSATDVDMGNPLTYTLGGTEAGSFAISNVPVASGVAVPVTVATSAGVSSLVSPVTVTVRVDDGNNTAATNVEIVIIAGNVAPVFANAPYNFNIASVATEGTTVGSVSATDSNVDNLLVYTISGEGADHFAISNRPVPPGEEVPVTVSATAALDHETTPSYTLEVQASDGTHTATTHVVINLFRPDYDTNANGLIDITTLEQLNAIRWDLDGNGEVDEATDADAYAAAFPDAMFTMAPTGYELTGYELMADLDFNVATSYASGAVDKGWSEAEAGEGWVPIGYYVDDTDNAAFVATFSGSGNTLSNLYVNRGSADYIGLFGYVGAPGRIREVGLLNVNVTGNDRVGGLVGVNGNSNTGTVAVMACYTTGAVRGNVYVGGLVGRNWNFDDSNGTITITDSYTEGSVEGNDRVGGLVGDNYNNSSGMITITDSYAEGNVEGNDRVGGLVGDNYNNSSGMITITDSYAEGNVVGDRTGGLVGMNRNSSSGTLTITSSYATGTVTGNIDNVTGRNIDVGGLVGVNRNSSSGIITFTSSYATGAVVGNSYVGGLIGNNSVGTGTIELTTCYATGSVTGTGDNPDYTGGLIGHNSLFTAGGTNELTACYATGTVMGDTDVGGLVGRNHNESRSGTLTITSSYATGTVTGNHDIGGLVGDNYNESGGTNTIMACYATGTVTGDVDVGGLVGDNRNNSSNSSGTNTITSSYATGPVTGDRNTGGLVGVNFNDDNGTIELMACYATGAMTANSNVGGLVGHNYNTDGGTNTLTACYATGPVTGDTDVGGLVGRLSNDFASSTRLKVCYYDSGATGQIDTGKGEPRTTEDLRMPTGYTDIYTDWNTDIDNTATGADDPWDFGTDMQYPVLKADFDGNGSTADDIVRQRQ